MDESFNLKSRTKWTIPSPCMRFLAAGGEEGQVHIYDTRQLRCQVERLAVNSDVVTDVSFSPSHPALVAASLDGSIASFSTSN